MTPVLGFKKYFSVILVLIYMNKSDYNAVSGKSSEAVACEQNLKQTGPGRASCFYRSIRIRSGMGALVPVRTCAFGGKRD